MNTTRPQTQPQPPPPSSSSRPPSSRRALTRALELAQEAIHLDASNGDPEATVLAYAKSVALLNEVMERVMRGDGRRRRHRSVAAIEEEVRKLRLIHDTYADRIQVLCHVHNITPPSAASLSSSALSHLTSPHSSTITAHSSADPPQSVCATPEPQLASSQAHHPIVDNSYDAGGSIGPAMSIDASDPSVSFPEVSPLLPSSTTQGNISQRQGSNSTVFPPYRVDLHSDPNLHTIRPAAPGRYDAITRLLFMSDRLEDHPVALNGHSNSVRSVAPDQLLTSGSDDTTARIWSGTSGEANESLDVISTSDLLGYSQQDAINFTSTSIPLSNDITGYVSIQDYTAIGYGGFGDLFVGIHTTRGKVALKKPRKLLDDALFRRFLREVNLWCSVSHPHVLACLGMCRIGPSIYVVSPFIENGDLHSCMTRGIVLNHSKLLFEVVEALTHLHHRGIVHGDVKAQNILLGDDGSALLCDFGLAKAFDTMVTSTESKGVGSVRWMAPELFQDESRSMASDVYSLGITIAEVLSGHAPYLHISSNLAVMRHVADHGGRPAKEPLISPEGKSYAILWETAEKCWAHDPKARPHMAQVLAMLFPLTRNMA